MGIFSCPPLKDTPGPVAINFAPDFFFCLQLFPRYSGLRPDGGGQRDQRRGGTGPTRPSGINTVSMP